MTATAGTASSIATAYRTLANGLRVVAVELPHLHSAELALYLKVGGRNDPAGKAGLSHVLEHMLFRGTVDFPTSQEIETAFEAIGGSINASTDEECTCFFSRVHPDHLDRGVEILSSMILRPLLDDLEVEKRIIAEEALDDLNDRGEEINPHNLASRLLWPEHPLGEPTIGTLESIASMTRDDLVGHLQRYYLPGNALLVAAGRFPARTLFTAAERYLSPWPSGMLPADHPPVEEQHRPQSVFISDADSQAHLQISFRSVSRHDPRLMPLRMLRRILCGSGSARLHLLLREQLGIVYSVDATIAAYDETGYVSVELSTGRENLVTAVNHVLDELYRLTAEPVPAEELLRVCRSYCYELEYSRDSCYDMQGRYGWGELMNDVRSIEDDAAAASAISAGDLMAVSRQLFRPDRLNLVVVGSWQEDDRQGVERELARYEDLWRDNGC